MHPVICTIEGFTLTSYSLMILLGALAAILLARVRRVAVPIYDLCHLAVMGLVGAAIGGKLLYLVVNASRILADLKNGDLATVIAYYLSGGFVLYGGIGGLFAGLAFASKTNGLDFAHVCDDLAPSLALAIAFGRLGCLFAGCCYGRPYDGLFALVYPAGSPAPAGVPLFPSPIVECLALVIVTIALTVLGVRKVKWNLMVLFLLSYSVLRFFLEMMRGDGERGFVGFLSTSQLISLAIVLTLAILMARKSRIVMVNCQLFPRFCISMHFICMSLWAILLSSSEEKP